MYTKALIFFAVVAAVTCQGWDGSWEGNHHEPPHYSYEYKVHDGHTGDIKAQHESREGDVVKGYYTLKEADGTTREVHYTADKHSGFNAEVKRIGHAHHAPVHHAPVHHAPVYHAEASPNYDYEYKVHDGHTGDVKAQHESREGDVVKGYYTLKEADGTTREVHYTADKHNGFNAEVKKIGHAHHAPVHHGWN